MKRKFGAICLLALGCLCLLIGCTAREVPENVETICELFAEKGYVCTVDDQYGLLSSLGSAMEKALKMQLAGGLAGHVCAMDKNTGKSMAEVFVFEEKRDAQKMYNYFEDHPQFVKGESEVRISGKTVYMGYIEALNAIEK